MKSFWKTNAWDWNKKTTHWRISWGTLHSRLRVLSRITRNWNRIWRIARLVYSKTMRSTRGLTRRYRISTKEMPSCNKGTTTSSKSRSNWSKTKLRSLKSGSGCQHGLKLKKRIKTRQEKGKCKMNNLTKRFRCWSRKWKS